MRNIDRTNPYGYLIAPDDEHGWLYAWDRPCAPKPEGGTGVPEPSKFYSSSDMLSFADGYVTALEDLGITKPEDRRADITDTHNYVGDVRVICTNTTTESMEAN
ncbi:hypothetical protein [Corynebacterium antarcticum]|uniref:hypothetical protein n=1 Tax=Corynebacterium antarcticum TaxID=2800405 RepID=UPI002260E70B|nr:hypothetical protein [Corynebacterium antarcticum]MCX7540625.1 hypothetical protein [Corynebacterium antarcticum]